MNSGDVFKSKRDNIYFVCLSAGSVECSGISIMNLDGDYHINQNARYLTDNISISFVPIGHVDVNWPSGDARSVFEPQQQFFETIQNLVGANGAKEYCFCRALQHLFDGADEGSICTCDVHMAIWYLQKFLELREDKGYEVGE